MCFHVGRGLFYIQLLHTARLRFVKLRQQQVHERAAFPSRKSRHEKVDYKDLVKRSEKDYVDYQEERCMHERFNLSWAV